MAVKFRARARREQSAPDLTPLIDVVFLLLIFFILTSTFAQQDHSLVPVDLPEGGSGEGLSDNTSITLYLDADGAVTVESADGELVTITELADLEELLTILHDEEPDRALYLRGDRDVPYGRVMSLLDLARTVGFRRVFNVLQLPGQ